jgi:pimeloyl-ACP methyl ester carboxylesterase
MNRLRATLYHFGLAAAVSWTLLRQTCLAEPDTARVPNAGEAPTAEAPGGTEVDDAKGVTSGGNTLGGLVFWRDEKFFHGWRIQRHCWSGQCRLLDGDNKRHATGSFDECQAKLDEIRTQLKLPPMKGRAVVLIHGLGAIRALMEPLGKELEKQGYAVFNVTYPSTRTDLAEHARGLANCIASLEGIEEINIVAHSMGNLVTRHYLGDCRDGHCPPDPRIRRFVMLAPPNHGAQLATEWGKNVIFSTFVGASAMQIGPGWADVEKRLAVPSCEFGIIAGGKGDDRGFNRHLDGDDDGLISVETTKLPGARDFVLVPYPHTQLLFKPDVHEYVVRFLAEGRFKESQ